MRVQPLGILRMVSLLWSLGEVPAENRALLRHRQHREDARAGLRHHRSRARGGLRHHGQGAAFRPGTLLINVILRKSIMRLSKVAALVLIVGATGLVSVFLARAASDCPTSVTLSDWGENSTGYFSVASGGSCLFPIKMAGEVSSSEISQKPAHGKLKRLNISTYEYTAKACQC